MKHIFILLFFYVQLSLPAQDTIYKRTGEIIPAKALEITIKEVSYKRFDLLDGPLFVNNKNDIRKIKYVTGTIDSFKVFIEAPKRPSVIFATPTYISQENSQIKPSLRKGIYQYLGNLISDRNVLFLAQEKNQVWNNKDLDLNIIDCKRNKALQYSIGYSGAVIGGIGLYGSILGGTSIGSNSTDFTNVALYGILSACVLVSSQIVSFTYKFKRIKNADKVAGLYNQLSKN